MDYGREDSLGNPIVVSGDIREYQGLDISIMELRRK